MNSSKIKSLINNNISKEKAYNVIVKPVVTEKSTTLSENNQIVFLVNINSNKFDIKKVNWTYLWSKGKFRKCYKGKG